MDTPRMRTETRTRLVDKTLGNKTHRVPETYEVQVPDVPKAPADWDMIVFRLVLAGTTLSVLGAMVWSTVSIGGLLGWIAPAWTAYTVAGVFDLAWVVCMALEWLSKNDPERAEIPRRAGWAALAISMALITGHGAMLAHLEDDRTLWAVGVGGALVSAIAKSLWSVVMSHNAVELPEDTRAWLVAERAEHGAELATAASLRSVQRMRSRIAAERMALGLEAPEVPAHRVVLDSQPEPVSIPAAGVPDTLSYPDPEETVRTRVLSSSGMDAGVRPAPRLGRVSVQSTVNDLYRKDPDMDGTDVRSAVRDTHGQDTSESSIAKAITRSPYRRTGTE